MSVKPQIDRWISLLQVAVTKQNFVAAFFADACGNSLIMYAAHLVDSPSRTATFVLGQYEKSNEAKYEEDVELGTRTS